jgi:hypothetical protein
MANTQRHPKVEAWLKREAREQQARYKKIAKGMNETLAPQREQWIAEFFERIQTRGFNTHSFHRRQIHPEELPARPKRKLKVVF